MAQEKLKTIIVQNLRALWYVMVFSGVVSYQWARFCNGLPFEILPNTRFLFACGSKHFYGHGSQFYDHLALKFAQRFINEKIEPVL